MKSGDDTPIVPKKYVGTFILVTTLFALWGFANDISNPLVAAVDPRVEADYMAAIRKSAPDAPAPVRLERFAFYERARHDYACIVTGTTAKYGNLILKKGVVDCG